MKNYTSYSDWAKNNPDLVTPREPAQEPANITPTQEPVNITPTQEPVNTTPAMDFQIPTGAPQTRLNQSRNEIVNTTQDMANSQLRQAEHRAQGHEALAAALRESEDKARKIAFDTETQVAANDEEQKKLHAKYTEYQSKIFEPPVEPKAWQKTVKVLGDILSVAAQGWLGPAGNVIGVAMSAIDHAVSKNVYRQLDEKEGAKENIGIVKELLESANKEDSDHIRDGHALVGLNYLATSKQIERLAEEAKTPEEREVGLQLALATRERFFQLNEKWAREDQTRQDQLRAQQQAAAAARANLLAQTPDWSRMPIAQLEALEASGQAPASLHEYLSNLKNKDRVAAGSGGDAPAPIGRTVVNPGVWNSLGAPEKANYRAAEAAMQAYERDSRALDKLLAEHGTEAFGENAKKMAALQASLLGSYKEIKGLGALDNGVIELTDRAHGDPTAWFAGGEGVRSRLAETRRSLRAGFEQRAKTLGLSSLAEAPPDAPPDLAPRPNSAPPPPIEQQRQAAETRRREQYSKYIHRQGK